MGGRDTNFWSEELKERGHFKDIIIDRRITLKLILQK
jgi:hypothetical protein